MHDETLPQAIIRGRREGKTTELLEWLLRGHKTPRHPCWSRVIVVQDPRMVSYMLRSFSSFDDALVARGLLGGLDNVLVTYENFTQGRYQGMRGELEYAIDDLDCYLRWQFGARPSLYTMTGQIYSADDDRAKYEHRLQRLQDQQARRPLIFGTDEKPRIYPRINPTPKGKS